MFHYVKLQKIKTWSAVGRAITSALKHSWKDVYMICLTIDIASFTSILAGGMSAGCDNTCLMVVCVDDGGTTSLQFNCMCFAMCPSSIFLLQAVQHTIRNGMTCITASAAGWNVAALCWVPQQVNGALLLWMCVLKQHKQNSFQQLPSTGWSATHTPFLHCRSWKCSVCAG